MYNLPNILTISRIVVIPVIFLSVYIHSVWWSLLAAILFVVASITDYFDGYLARARNQISVFGRLLDPIADKLLVVSALMIIVANSMVHPVSYIPVMVILCREVLVSGLREFLSGVKVSMPVTNLAKWKTAFQMTSLSLILFRNIPSVAWSGILGEGLLWIAGILTFITGYQYFQKSLDYVKSLDKEPKKENRKENRKEKLEMAVKDTDEVKNSPKKPTKLVTKTTTKSKTEGRSKSTVKKTKTVAAKSKKIKKEN